MQPKTKKYLLDLESAIEEIEGIVTLCKSNYRNFENHSLAIRSMERLLEIIGEATKKMLESDNTIIIEHSNRIISLRNRLAHAYDSIDSSVLWSIAIKNVPKLKEELNSLSH